jgi:8-oxo-dGTP diphosphatase
MRTVSTEPLSVVAGLLFDAEGRVLLAARPPGKAFAGRWEFPGGKVDAEEPATAALARELAEELGVQVDPGDCHFFHAVTHRYPGATRAVRIAAYRVHRYAGQPQGQEGQALAWHCPARLPTVDILEADRPIVTALRLGSLISLAALDAEVMLFAQIAQVRPAASRTEMVGVWVIDAAQALLARDAGADFLMLSAPPDRIGRSWIAASGLPWFLPEGVATAGATGHWRGHYSSVDSSIST